MKRTNLIFTHAAVFSVGIATAMMLHGSRDPQAGPKTEENGRVARAGSSDVRESVSSGGITRTKSSAAEETRTFSKRDAKSPGERLGDIVRITDPLERQRSLIDLIDTLGPDQFAAVAEQFRELDHLGDSRGEYEMILRGWAKADPHTALDYVGQHGNGRSGSAAILSTWAASDPAAAERWAIDHFTGEGANHYLASVIRGIAATDVASATRLAESMPKSRERGDAVLSITDALFMQGIDAAMAYPTTITDAALRGGFISAIAQRLVEKNPDQAATWLASMDQGDAQNGAARQVGEALAREDTSKAAAWVSTLKPEARAEAAIGVIDLMSSKDITGTAQWVSSLAGTPGYDNVVEQFVWSCNSRAPEQSAAWIQGVSDPDQQRRLYHRMLGEWAQKDPAAVKQWVASNNVPESVRQRFSR
jgi:hypothetical protein